MDFRRVVITGLGAITPLGNSVSETWKGLTNGVSGADSISLFDASKFKTRFACELKNFNPTDYLDRKEVRRLDRFAQTALISAKEAVEHAGINGDQIDAEQVGVIHSSGIGGLNSLCSDLKKYYTGDGTPRFSPFFVPKMIVDIAAGHIAMKYNFRGPNFAVVSACASSTNAIIEGLNYIRMGKAKVIVAGGSESVINEAGLGGFNAMKALSERNDSPQTASRPFDLDRDGFVMGEGSGTLILEDLEHAKARGATIYAELSGGGTSADAYHITAPHPEGRGAVLAMDRALKNAETTPENIDYINVHGTSTPLGDIAEVKAIHRLFGDAIYKMNISSTKSMTGHLLGAAGAVEAIAGILALNHNIVPPTINHFTEDPKLDPKINFTFNTAQEREVNAVLSNTFGFGGHNATIILKKYIS